MAIDLNNGYRDLLDLWRTKTDSSLRLVVYGDPVDPENIAIEDMETHSVVLDFDRPEPEEDVAEAPWVIVSASMRKVWDGKEWASPPADPAELSLGDAVEKAHQLSSAFEARLDDSSQPLLSPAEMTDIMPQILRMGTQWTKGSE